MDNSCLENKKILIVINSLIVGGAEMVVINLIKSYYRHNIYCDLLMLESKGTLHEILKDFPEVKILQYKRNTSLYNPLKIFKIRSLFKKYDIMHVHLFPGIYMVGIARFLAPNSRIKLVYSD